MLILTSGLFFYSTVVRQDMVGKLLVSDCYQLPGLPAIKVMASAGVEGVERLVMKRVPSAINMFRWWSMVDSLVGRTFVCLAGHTLVGARGSEARWWVGGGLGMCGGLLSVVEVARWFVNFFFVWYRGLYSCTVRELDGSVVEFMHHRPVLLAVRNQALSLRWVGVEDYSLLPDTVGREPVHIRTTFLFNYDGYRCDTEMRFALLDGLRYTQRALP